MRCKDCPLSWTDEGAKCATCHADPNWPAPCEYEEPSEEELIGESYYADMGE